MEPMSMGPMVYGFQLTTMLMLASGVFYLLCAFLLWKPYRKEKNELIGALFAFLVYQAVNMFFMGLQMQTMNMVYSYVSAFAVFVGSAYMLKFPFSSFSRGTRRTIFYLSMATALSLFVWFMLTPARQMALMNFTLWYDVVINGLIVGGSIFFFGFMTKERWLRAKTLGGGAGVVSCCVVSNAAMLSGALLTSIVFSFTAPVIILGTLAVTRKKQ